MTNLVHSQKITIQLTSLSGGVLNQLSRNSTFRSYCDRYKVVQSSNDNKLFVVVTDLLDTKFHVQKRLELLECEVKYFEESKTELYCVMFQSEKEANDFCKVHPNWGVIRVQDGLIYAASIDTIMKYCKIEASHLVEGAKYNYNHNGETIRCTYKGVYTDVFKMKMHRFEYLLNGSKEEALIHSKHISNCISNL